MPDKAPAPTPSEPERTAPGGCGASSERDLFLPRPGESAEAYAARLRRIRAELTRLLGAVERGLRARDAPGVRRTGRFLRAEPEGVGAPLPVPGEDRQRSPDIAAAMRDALAPRPARPSGGEVVRSEPSGAVPAGTERRGADRRGPVPERRAEQPDRRVQALGAPHDIERRAGAGDRRQPIVDRRRGVDRRSQPR
ncbi:MAG: hypothetical protein QOH43_2398 [Solirubrobacteraceae bacterium]|jgi:hypothetical protein|nr:hypothetical protein [Solirubrobacteraceae bacterium]